MTDEMLRRGEELRDEIAMLKNAVITLNAQLRHPYRESKPKKKWKIRFTNAQKKCGEPKRAAIYLFNGIDIHGLDIPVEEGLVETIRDYFQKCLMRAQAEFDSLGVNTHE